MAENRLIKAANNESGTLEAQLLAADTSATLSVAPKQAPGVITLEIGTVKEERVYYASKNDSTKVISGLIRDYTNENGGVGMDHDNGASWETAQDAEYVNNLVDAIIEGYIIESNTVARVDATDFTVTGDQTSVYTAGRVLRFNKDNTKIGLVVSSSYNSGTGLTTVVTSGASVPSPLTTIEYAIQPKNASVASGLSIQNNSFTYSDDTGSANAYVATLSPAPSAYTKGMSILFKAVNANTGASTLNVNSLGTKTIKKNGGSDLVAGDIKAGQIIEVFYDGTNFQIPPAGVLNIPQGFLINGKIVTSVATNNLTVAIKTLSGNDPSSSDPVFVRIGNTIRSITAALSVTKNAGTNWFNSGASETATLEIDYFVYLGYNATDGVVIGFARRPDARTYGDFSTSTTNTNYAAISTITNATSTDEYENIGRFNAILSASASFNWSIPATSIIVNRPIFETRFLSWTPTYSASGSMTFSSVSTNTAKYKIRGQNNATCYLYLDATGTTGGTASTQILLTIPVTASITGDSGPLGVASLATFLGKSFFSDTVHVALGRYDAGSVALTGGFVIIATIEFPLG